MYFRFLWIILLLPGCISTTPPPRSTPTSIPTQTTSTGQCTYGHAANGAVLPDLTCTPGESDSTITQANVSTTICVAGWLDQHRPRPAVEVTNQLKRQSLVVYGQATDLTAAIKIESKYEEDHLIPRELGGLSAVDVGANGLPTNLWAEPQNSPNEKDRVESALHSLVCKSINDPKRMLLAEAQKRIVQDWTTALP